MKQARWDQIEELLQAALDLHPDQRAAFLSRACGGDEELLRELEALLGQEDDAPLLESPAIAAFVPHALELPLSGRQIGRYRIEGKIGAGGMGEVHEARDESLHRTVALKVLPAEFTADAERVRRLEQEAFAASRLNHPNIVTIFEIVHAGETHFIVTERVDGVSLRDVMTDEQNSPRKLTVEKALDITMQVAAALKAAHTAWIIHRDIKPENIMVRSDGLVKVVDFGIAKLNDEPSAPTAHPPLTAGGAGDTRAHLTVPGAILGTARYMSPEQARGEALDGRTDIYSLGLVFFEMLTGSRFSIGTSRLEQIARTLQRIVRRALQPDREQRYASAAELLNDLETLKRRLESRTARRMVGLSGLAVAAALTIAALAAMLSINEGWDERVLRDGHSAAARQAVFSPDGRLLVSCGEDGRVIVWDFARRERLATLNHRAHKVAYSPDGRWFATGGTDGTIVIWDAKRRERVRVLTEHRGEIGALAFSPDATVLASASTVPDVRTVLWRTDRWETLNVRQLGGPHGTFVFSPNGRQVLSSYSLTAYDLIAGQLSDDVQNGANWIALSPDADRLATIDPLGNVRFYRFPEPGNLARHELIARRRAHQDHGRAVAFSPDGRLVATGADDILLWDAATQQKIARFEHSAIVWSIAFSPDGRWLVSAHGDGAVLIWNVAERERAANLNEHSGSVRAVAFAPDGRRVASAGEDRTVTVWDAELGRKQAVLTDHQTRVTSLSFSGDRQLASGDQDGNVILWDLAKRQARLTVKPSAPLATYCVALSPDGRLVATSHGVFNTTDGRALIEFYPEGKNWKYGNVYGVAFSADGRRVATAMSEGWVGLWDVESARPIEIRELANTHQITVAVSPDGKWLVTGEDEGAVRLWSVNPLRDVAVLGRHAARVKAVAFAPDGATVASAGDDKMIALWDVKRRKLRTRIGTHASPVYSVAFSPDGRRLVSGEHDRSVRLYTRKRTLWGFRLED